MKINNKDEYFFEVSFGSGSECIQTFWLFPVFVLDSDPKILLKFLKVKLISMFGDQSYNKVLKRIESLYNLLFSAIFHHQINKSWCFTGRIRIFL